jgi:hypothetical protein
MRCVHADCLRRLKSSVPGCESKGRPVNSDNAKALTQDGNSQRIQRRQGAWWSHHSAPDLAEGGVHDRPVRRRGSAGDFVDAGPVKRGCDVCMTARIVNALRHTRFALTLRRARNLHQHSQSRTLSAYADRQNGCVTLLARNAEGINPKSSPSARTDLPPPHARSAVAGEVAVAPIRCEGQRGMLKKLPLLTRALASGQSFSVGPIEAMEKRQSVA